MIGSIARMQAQLGDDPPGRGDPTSQAGMSPPPLITDDESSDNDKSEDDGEDVGYKIMTPHQSAPNTDESADTISTWLSEDDSDEPDFQRDLLELLEDRDEDEEEGAVGGYKSWTGTVNKTLDQCIGDSEHPGVCIPPYDGEPLDLNQYLKLFEGHDGYKTPEETDTEDEITDMLEHTELDEKEWEELTTHSTLQNHRARRR